MITYQEKERIFKLDTPNTSYMIGIVDEENFIGHIYYGKRNSCRIFWNKNIRSIHTQDQVSGISSDNLSEKPIIL